VRGSFWFGLFCSLDVLFSLFGYFFCCGALGCFRLSLVFVRECWLLSAVAGSPVGVCPRVSFCCIF
jgi:hypothetical protein